jgi:hypothetical protein
MYELIAATGIFNHPPGYETFTRLIRQHYQLSAIHNQIKDKINISEKELFDIFYGDKLDAIDDAAKTIDSWFSDSPSSSPSKSQTPESAYQTEKNRLLSEGWKATELTNGRMSSCYNVVSKTEDIDNYLDIYVGGNTAVAVKIMNYATGICIRYVYVNSNTSYRIRNIPQGRYILKIAYGKEWYSKIENGRCVGRFLRSPLYKKGDDILDYNLQYDYAGEQYNIPSYSVRLDVVSSNRNDEFETTNITEDEFNR